MSKTPAQNSVTLSENQPFLDIRYATIEEVTLASDVIDTDNTPTTQLRKGLVVGEESAGTFVDAADAGVVAHANAAITSAEAPDGDWEAETLTVQVVGDGGPIVYTLGTNTTVSNLATAIADINASSLSDLVVASSSGANLLITANKAGALLSVTCSLATAYAAGAGVETTAAATFTKYGILMTTIPSTLGIDSVAETRNASIVTRNARCRESDVLGLTTAARQWFEANGVSFE